MAIPARTVKKMSIVMDDLLSEVKRLCNEKSLSDTATTIITWFAHECMTTSSRIESSELKSQLMRLGREIDGGGESDDA